MASPQENSSQAKKRAILEGKEKIALLPTINEHEETAQGVTALIPGEASFNPAINEEGEWTKVSRKRSRFNFSNQKPPSHRKNSWPNARRPSNLGNRSNPSNGGFAPEEIQKEYHTAFKERRCFRCLSRSHQRAQCREPLRCFKCKQIGHPMISRCPRKFERQNQPLKGTQKGSAAFLKLATQGKTYAQIVKNQQQDNPLSKEMEPEPFAEVRPDESHVFASPREFLRPQNQFLDSTVMLVMVQGVPQPDMCGDIARCFARRFGWHWQDYQVFTARETPFLAICPGPNLKDSIVAGGIYTIRPGVQVWAIEWGIELNMAYDPPPYEAWIKISDLPLQTFELRKSRNVLM